MCCSLARVCLGLVFQVLVSFFLPCVGNLVFITGFLFLLLLFLLWGDVATFSFFSGYLTCLTSLLSPIVSSPVIVSMSLIRVDLSAPVIILKFWFGTRQILLKLLSDAVLHAAMLYSRTGRTYPTYPLRRTALSAPLSDPASFLSNAVLLSPLSLHCSVWTFHVSLGSNFTPRYVGFDSSCSRWPPIVSLAFCGLGERLNTV